MHEKCIFSIFPIIDHDANIFIRGEWGAAAEEYQTLMIVWMCLEQEESQSVIDVSDTKQNKSDSDEESTSNYYVGKRFYHKISLQAIQNCIYYFYQ